MSEQQQLTTKEELLAILQESINYVQKMPEEEILKKNKNKNHTMLRLHHENNRFGLS